MVMSRIGKLYNYTALVKKQTGKSRLRQLSEMCRLAAGPQRLGLEEYFEFEVFNDNFYPPERKTHCVGWRASEAIDKRLNKDYWRATANDKVLNYALLRHYGFPIPETLATYSPRGRRVGAEQVLTSRQDLEVYVTQAMPFPIFIKPIHGSYGGGTRLLKSYNASTKQFSDAQGQSVAVGDLLDACMKPQYMGMLFQRCLKPHPLVASWFGTATSCVRVIVLLSDHGPKIHAVFWKIARAHNITDNFHMGATGNLLAALDLETGRIERVVTGLWPHGKSVAQHPDTQQELIGKIPPDWTDAMELCLSAATNFPGLALQHWDVAFCDGGPVLMELNTEADLGVPQFLARHPFVDERIANLLKGH